MTEILQRYGSRFALWGVLFILASRLAQANDPHQVGLVVVHGNGQVTSQCITFQGEEISGYELLEQSNLDLNIDASNSMGATICRLDGEGCNYPQDDCFCQCQSSRNCIYWSYWHLDDGQWQYSSLGSSSYSLHGGEVQGWVWSKGNVGSSAEKAPPQTSFEAICAPAPTDTPIPTETVTPSATATASSTATNTPQPPTVTPTFEATHSPHPFDEVGLATPPPMTPTVELLATSQPTMTVETPTHTPTPPLPNQTEEKVAAVSPVETLLVQATLTPTPSPTATELVKLATVDNNITQPSPTPLEILPTPTLALTLPAPLPSLTPLAKLGAAKEGDSPEVKLASAETSPTLVVEKRRVMAADSPSESSSWLIFGTMASLGLLLLLVLPVILLMVGGLIWWIKGYEQ